MARMIPSVISPEIKSNAEKHIFEWFKNDPRTDDWVVLHSLGIANHNKVIHGETDFFVLVPYMGLFALEVKGGRVSRKDGIWSFTDKHGNVNSKERGPFDQAWDGVHSIIDDIKSKLDYEHRYLKNIFYGIGVMFPDIDYETVGCDEAQWQVFDRSDGNDVYKYIKRLFDGACERWYETYSYEVPNNKLPSDSDIEYIASLLRGDFDKAVATSVQIKYSEEEFVNLTSEQYRTIDQMEYNDRCLIEGGAGTGKTLLAAYDAKNAVANGMKTAVLCFNKNLGEWLQKYFDDMPQNLRPAYVGTFHKYMAKVVKDAGISISYPNSEELYGDFYSEDLPAAACMALNRLRDERFDKIIVDEAQDLISDRYLEVLDKCLIRGLSRGRWTFFGDFSHQAIYNKEATRDKMINKLTDITGFGRCHLTINCRNTRTICDEIVLVTDFKAPSDVWSKVSGVPVQYLSYSSREEQASKLKQTIEELLANHISPKQITILSPVKREKSVVSELSDMNIRDYKTYSNNKLSFCTVQAFKGLENSVVILTDIESISDKQLMYVALSRARSGLYVLISESAREDYLQTQMRRFLNGYKARANN